jgi:hypothetical protein
VARRQCKAGPIMSKYYYSLLAASTPAKNNYSTTLCWLLDVVTKAHHNDRGFLVEVPGVAGCLY